MMNFSHKKAHLSLVGRSSLFIAVMLLASCDIGFSAKNANKIDPNLISDVQPSASPEVAPHTVPDLEGLIVIAVKPNPNPFQYQVDILWPAVLKNVQVRMDGANFINSRISDGNGLSLLVGHNETHRFEIFAEAQSILENKNSFFYKPTQEPVSGQLLVLDKKINTPRDLFLSDSLHFKFNELNSFNVNRLFMTVDDYFVARHYHFYINANELIILYGCDYPSHTDQGAMSIDCRNRIPTPKLSDINQNDEANYAAIRTLHPEIYSGNWGLSGSTILIKAKKATGHLKVFMHGGDGKNGIDETWQNSATYGANGGDSGVFKIEVSEDSPDFSVEVDVKAGKPGLPGKRLSDKSYSIQGKEPFSGKKQDYCVSIGKGFGPCSF